MPNVSDKERRANPERRRRPSLGKVDETARHLR